MPADTSTFKDLTIALDASTFGLDAASTQHALRAEGIDSRRYYHPPIHRQKAYADRWDADRPLPVTDELADSVLSPPLWSHMADDTIDRLASTVVELHQHASQIVAAQGHPG